MASPGKFYEIVKQNRHSFSPSEIGETFSLVSEKRVEALADCLSNYISINLAAAIQRRSDLSDYRTNPYVLMSSASIMGLANPSHFASFLFNNKMYMGLETSFGKSIESEFVKPYPIGAAGNEGWRDPPEKTAEAAALQGLSNEEKALIRTESVWREVDKAVVYGSRRYMTSIKSGPNCINDTQVQAMTAAISGHCWTWMEKTKEIYPHVSGLDVVIGITYGTDRTTNNKENQILVKLLNKGFVEEDRRRKPGVLIDKRTKSIRVYRRIGKDFWAFIGAPHDPASTPFVFLEILLALAKALSKVVSNADLETKVNLRMQALSDALAKLVIPGNCLPEWIREDFSPDELFWFATAMTAFYDEGI